MIVNQVIPGQEEGNARLITEYDLGAVAEKNREVPDSSRKPSPTRRRALAANGATISPASAGPTPPCASPNWCSAECRTPATRPASASSCLTARPAASRGTRPTPRRRPRMLLCDFHIHTNYSDGKLTVPEVVDFYGRRGFDCICITDHLADPRRLIGKLARTRQHDHQRRPVGGVFRRASNANAAAPGASTKCSCMTGIEFNKDGYTEENLRAPARHRPQGADRLRRSTSRRSSRRFTRRAAWPSPRIRTS